ncbi:copper chaperone PCu(A)C [Corallococcus praedator]|uniref:Copper chaperone PCu(A)C n=1 Tax=Corallococcus praedator TaxID=2316724 RepID=A0ABX9Q3M9_9BACT|nr:copper chaperone PCu(A)C [Corallococcus praedator]RKH86945.1 copper chaperone PCu(A)C [Corallococcus praedator]
MKTGLLIPAIVMMAACHHPATLSVDKAWVRLSPVTDAPASAYFVLKGGAKDETLTGIAAPDAARAEMHENISHAGIESMDTLKLVAVRAGGAVPFALGGKHVMLFGLKPGIKAGSTTPLIFSFASGQKITVNAKVMPPGSSAPAD